MPIFAQVVVRLLPFLLLFVTRDGLANHESNEFMSSEECYGPDGTFE